MKRFFCVLCVLGGVLLGSAQAQSCPSNGWCKTQSASDGATRFLDRAWNKMVYDKANRQMDAWFQSADAPTTFSNAVGHYALLSSPGTVTANKWTMDTYCGSTMSNGYASRQDRLHLNAAIDTSAAPFNITLGVTDADTGAIQINAVPQSGYIYVGDEMFAYDSCTSSSGTGTCQVGESGPLTIHVTARNQRTAAGWVASPVAHTAGTEAGGGEETTFACPGPFGIGSDHPPGNHPYGNLAYDLVRDRLWWNNGTQENWQFRDTWYRCTHTSAACPDTTSGWQHVPEVASGTTGVTNAEDVTIYADDADALLHFGGTRSGSVQSALWIFCLSANSTWVDATHTCASSGYVNTWRQVTPHGGTALAAQRLRGTYDTVNDRALFFTGAPDTSSDYNPPVVEVYNPATGDFCLSDRSHGGANASSCPAGFASNAASPPPGQRFPMWTFNKRSGKGAYLCCVGGPNGRVYQYDAALNTWAYTDVDTANAPVIDANVLNGVDWTYADESSAGAGDDMFVALAPAYIGGNSYVEMYQLPASALGEGQPPTTYTYSITLAGTGSGSVSDGAGFTCSSGTCTHDYAAGATPTFSATPSGGGSFAGWSAGTGDLSACSGTGTCGGTASQASGVTATFNPPSSASTTFSGVTVTGVQIQ